MIELTLQALGKLITNSLAPHVSLTLRYSQELDVVDVLKKNPEIQTRKDGGTLENPTVSSFLLGVFNRGPFRKKSLGRHHTLTLLSENPLNPLRWDESFATFGEVEVNYRLASRQLDILEGFELFYNTRIRPYGNLSMKVRLSETPDAPEIPLYFQIFCEDVQDISQVSGSEHGSLWKLDFSIRVLGFFISADVKTYPKLNKAILQAHFGSPDSTRDAKFAWTVLTKDIKTGVITREDNVKLP